jgi:hypothetical protein
MVKIGCQGIIGEEGVFYQTPTAHDIICSIDGSLFFIKTDDLLNFLPDAILDRMKQLYESKQAKRNAQEYR